MNFNNKKDLDLIAEAYDNIDEGILDQLKARGSQAVGAVKGLGQQAVGVAKQAAGKVVAGAGNLAAKGVQAVGGTIDPSSNKLVQAGANLQKAGQTQQAAGTVQGENAKIASYQASAIQSITNLQTELLNDFKALGIVIPDDKLKGFNSNINRLKNQIAASIQALIQ